MANDQPAATCRYCAGKGGRYRLVYSRFVGCEPVVHEGPWEKCWACNGTGEADADALADLACDRETISGG